MSISRRNFVKSLQRGAARPLQGAVVAARGREAMIAEAGRSKPWEPALVPPPDTGTIRISSNENPLGPGKTALDALVGDFSQAGRYPFHSQTSSSDLTDLLAAEFHAEPDNIVLGAGSTEILRNAVRAFTSPHRALVTADPSFEVPVRTAELTGTPVRAVRVDTDLRLDLEAMARAARGAGLVFLCNPNNPTATVHSYRAVADFIAAVFRDSPETVILVDEAYHHYVTDGTYGTAVRLALTQPGVLVSRTFSKAYGMAGLRIGYAVGQKQTIQRLARYRLSLGVNVFGIAAAAASFNDAAHIASEQERNEKVRKFTVDFFQRAGYRASKTQANFVFVDIGSPAGKFRDACRKRKVEVGREFPPFEKTHARISIGTMAEMQRAVEVFREVLEENGPAARQPDC